MTQAHPLQWPAGWPRTRARKSSGQFKVSADAARKDLIAEIHAMGGRYPVISSNIPTRRDGGFNATAAKGFFGDPGVAVYFEREGKPFAFACDTYDSVRANVRAIGLTLAALRGMERWGVSDAMERAFTGFEQLPHPDAITKRHWRQVFGLPPTTHVTPFTIETLFKQLAKERHPDHGGSHELMAELNTAYEEAKAAFK